MTNFEDSKNVEMIKLLAGIYSELKKLNNSMDEFTKKPGEQEKAGIADILSTLRDIAHEHITDFLKDAILYKTIDSGKYKTIKNYEVDKYQYNYHSYKKD